MILVLLVGMGLVFGVWIFAFRRYWDKGIVVSITFLSNEVYAGEQGRLTEIVENRKKIPVPVIEVRFSVRKGLDFEGVENTNVSDLVYKRDIFSLLGMQKITRQITFGCEKRGYYKIQDAELIASSLLYTEQYIKKLPQPSSVYVYPKQVDVKDILGVSMQMLGEVQREKRFVEDPFAFRSIREYTPLDPQKTINWKASAKTGRLMVNTFDSSLRGKFMIYLDVEDSGILVHENLMEESISVASTLARSFTGSGMEVGLAMNTGKEEARILAPAGGQAQTVKINRRLAEYEKKDGYCPFSEILKEKPADTVFLIISKEMERRADIEAFLGKDGNGIWIYPTDETKPSAKLSAASFVREGNLRFLVREVSS